MSSLLRLLSAPKINTNLAFLTFYIGEGFIPISRAPTLEISLCRILKPFQASPLFITLEFTEIFLRLESIAFNCGKKKKIFI